MGFSWIYLGWLFSAVFLFLMLRTVYNNIMPGFRQFKMEYEVLKCGIGVTADIIHRSKTGMISGEEPVYRLTFKFVTRDGVEVQSSLERALDRDEFMRYAPGNGVDLKYDPKDPKRIALYPNDRPMILGD